MSEKRIRLHRDPSHIPRGSGNCHMVQYVLFAGVYTPVVLVYCNTNAVFVKLFFRFDTQERDTQLLKNTKYQDLVF